MKAKYPSLLRILFALGVSWSVGAFAQPVPEFFGVYVAVGGKLEELKPANKERSPYITLTNTYINSPSFTAVSTGDVQFVLYSQEAARFSPSIQRLARVVASDELNLAGRAVDRKWLPDSWYPKEKKEELRIAPVPSNPQMMLRAVPSRPLTSGLWVLSFGGNHYVIGVGANPKQASDCLIQMNQFMALSYRDCNPGESARGASTSTSGGGSSSQSKSATDGFQGDWVGELVEEGRSVPVGLKLQGDSSAPSGVFNVLSEAGEIKEGSEFSIQDGKVSSGGLLSFTVPLGSSPRDWIGCKLVLNGKTLEGTCREQREGALALPISFSKRAR